EAPNREERRRCWKARDEFLACLEANKIDVFGITAESTAASEPTSGACGKLELAMRKACPAAWASYFITRQQIEKRLAE
ncbi:hypothetical protein GQ42DRAFT_111974, partial [Ramicandelaber brevisporus]